MDQNYGNGGASEDTSRAEEHVRRAEENRDALAAQHQRTEETTPADADMSASGTGRPSDDASEARANVQNAEANRDALEAQNDRVERTTPEDLQGSR